MSNKKVDLKDNDNSEIFTIKLKNWNIEEMTGYKPKTTFYTDFSIADKYGIDAIKDTYNRAFNEWHTDTEYITELTMALNWKIWEHYEHNDAYANLYNELWEKCDNWCRDNLKGDDLTYFYNTTD